MATKQLKIPMWPLLGSTGEQCYRAMGTMEGYREEEGPTLENGDGTDGKRSKKKTTEGPCLGDRTAGRTPKSTGEGEAGGQVTGHLCEDRLRGYKREHCEKWLRKVARFL